MKTSILEVLAIIGGVITIITALYGVYAFLSRKSYKKAYKDVKLATLEGKIDDLPCERQISSITEIKVKLGALKPIQENIRLLMGVLIPPKVFTVTESPIKVTPEGEIAAEKMEISKHIKDNWENIVKYIDEHKESMNAYDIQQLCTETASLGLDNFFLPDGVDQVKTHVFNSGIPFKLYGYLIGVMIRDAYFKEKNIDVTEVDKHDPLKKK